jgi:hypothetical protein
MAFLQVVPVMATGALCRLSREHPLVTVTVCAAPLLGLPAALVSGVGLRRGYGQANTHSTHQGA